MGREFNLLYGNFNELMSRVLFYLAHRSYTINALHVFLLLVYFKTKEMQNCFETKEMQNCFETKEMQTALKRKRRKLLWNERDANWFETQEMQTALKRKRCKLLWNEKRCKLLWNARDANCFETQEMQTAGAHMLVQKHKLNLWKHVSSTFPTIQKYGNMRNFWLYIQIFDM